MKTSIKTVERPIKVQHYRPKSAVEERGISSVSYRLSAVISIKKEKVHQISLNLKMDSYNV